MSLDATSLSSLTLRSLQGRLKRGQSLILDGALGTILEEHGYDLGGRLWSSSVLIENPLLIEQIHSSYFEAGADFGTSASFQATFAGFAKMGLSARKAQQLMRLSVELVCRARNQYWKKLSKSERRGKNRPWVLASSGSYWASLGQSYEFTRNRRVSHKTLVDFHLDRLKAWKPIAKKVDAVLFETIPSLKEADAILEALDRVATFNAMVSFVCQPGPRLADGGEIAEAVRRLDAHPRILAIGVNCVEASLVESVLESMTPFTKKPLIVYPQGAQTMDSPPKFKFKGARGVATYCQRWKKAGASIIGGCCLAGPQTIANIARWKKRL